MVFELWFVVPLLLLPHSVLKLLRCWIRYEKYHVCYGGEEEERKANYTDMVRDDCHSHYFFFLMFLYNRNRITPFIIFTRLCNMYFYRLINTMILSQAFTSSVGASRSILHLGMTYYLPPPAFDRPE